MQSTDACDGSGLSMAPPPRGRPGLADAAAGAAMMRHDGVAVMALEGLCG